MAKKYLILLALALFSPQVFGQFDRNEYESHANGVSIAAQTAYEAGAVTATVETDDQVMNIKVKELHLNITPSFKFVIPDAAVSLGLQQRIGDTTLEAATEYNYIYNQIRYALKYMVEFFVPVGVSLYDNIDFQQTYLEQKYIQRTKGLGVSMESPVIFSAFKFGEEFKNETSYLAKLYDGLSIDQGLASIFNTWFEFRLKGVTEGKEFNLVRYKVGFEKAVPSRFSSYCFLFLNTALTSNLRLNAADNIMLRVETGHLLEAQQVPLWKVYSMGGFDSMIGYGVNSLQDYFKVAGRVRLDKQIAGSLNWELPLIRIDRISGFIIADCGIAGDVYEIQDFDRYKFGAGAGVTLDFTFRKRTPIRATFAIGQAIDSGMSPVVYFIYELL